MKNKNTIEKRFINLVFIVVLILSNPITIFSVPLNGSVRGKVVDENNLEMIAVNIGIEGTNFGTITNLEGKYQLLNIPEGQYNLVFSFVGYETKKVETIVKDGSELEINVQLLPASILTGEVTISAQAKGQISAINQQLNSQGIINVVSNEKLKELPDVSVAEAIGRLPGISVQRDGGEGQKIIVRGFEPKYNTVAINGMNSPSTDFNNRSTDMNFVSADIISGVEVMKANTADKDADGLGGNVNLMLKQADSGLKLNAYLESGYTTQINAMGAYKGGLYFSNRFFKEKLGMLVSASAESYDRSSDQWENEFDVTGNPNYDAGETFVQPWLTSSNLKSVVETRTRYNGSIFLDYKTKKSTIKSATFFSGLSRDYFVRSKDYSLDNSQLRFRQTEVERGGYIFSNAIDGAHNILNSKIDWGVGYSQSKQNKPYEHELLFYQLSPYIGNPSTYNTLDPITILTPEYVDEQIDEVYLYSGVYENDEALENEVNAWLNWEKPFNISEKIRGTFKTGIKFRQKDREKYTSGYKERFDNFSSRDAVLGYFPDMELSSHQDLIGINSFIDQSYQQVDYMNGQYPTLNLNYVLNRDMVSEFYDKLGSTYIYKPAAHVKEDYIGRERILAAYGMFDIKIGNVITFIPGLRFEQSYFNYQGYETGSISDDDQEEDKVDFEEVEEERSLQNFLPQIHLKIKPLQWFDIRLAYTNTLSRPDYTDLTPRMQFSSSSKSVKYSGTYLNPVLSENFDAIFTMYSRKYGLFSAGVFHKNIDGFIYEREAIMTIGTDTDPTNFGIPSSYKGYTIKYPKNNSEITRINGLEFDAQTNLSWLPKPFNGIVLSGNFTIMDSETKYQESLAIRTMNPDYGQPGEPRIIYVKYDTAYIDKMLLQAKYLANASLGYDFKGFSIRLSYSYTDVILTQEQRRTDGADREEKVAFQKWDMQINQKIKGKLSLYANVSNIFNQPDAGIRTITGYNNYVEYYGTRINVGIKYKFY